MFQKEKYLEINSFEVRQILCRFRISSHHLRVETERHRNNSLERSQRICRFCSQNDIEDEPHFIIKCAFYNSLREELYTKMQNYCKHFIKLDNESKCVWLMTTEDIFLVENVGHVTFYFYFVYAAFYRNCNAPTIAFFRPFPNQHR